MAVQAKPRERPQNAVANGFLLFAAYFFVEIDVECLHSREIEQKNGTQTGRIVELHDFDDTL